MKKYALLSVALLSILFIGFSRVSPAAEIEIVTHTTEEQGLFNNAVTATAPDGSDVFVASRGGLHVFIGDFFLPVFQNIAASHLSSDPDTGVLWASTDTGLIYKISYADGIWTTSRYPFDKKEPITALAARHGTLYFGTNKALYCFSEKDGLFNRIIGGLSIGAVSIMKDGTVIAGSVSNSKKKGGVLIVGGSAFGAWGPVAGLEGMSVSSLETCEKGLWIGTEKGDLFFFDQTGPKRIGSAQPLGAIRALMTDKRGLLIGSGRGLFIVSAGGVITPLKTPDGVTIPDVTTLAAKPSGDIWVGTGKDGLYLLRLHP